MTVAMNIAAFFAQEMDEHAAVLAVARTSLAAPLERLVELSATSVRAGGTIFLFGNGGSAADAQHLAAELAVRYVATRPPIAALALTTDTSVLTAIGNDFGFAAVFARQVEAVCRVGDVCIGLSTSGRSENVIAGLAAARRRGAVAAAFGGGDGGRLPEVADPLLLVPSRTTARIQEMHITLGQIYCAALERVLGLVGE
jgi:D-sedoheptulose 7-phosphate isomerase